MVFLKCSELLSVMTKKKKIMSLIVRVKLRLQKKKDRPKSERTSINLGTRIESTSLIGVVTKGTTKCELINLSTKLLFNLDT